ncbi:hypothetical protein [Paludisphaera borealis]|uniref:Uncharacterized protein n=1 Tax=Paludisphaera borealis TaxID=1387353 RepID=A0A1U7CK08_9BACT|nr:hypothetical protein [Paludisphaera borealis]APW59274.1 hypothetical protein BSF38_00690 [Paludisphaera borealis]MDR3619173.1 hypothetical protein [Paludisphaera borealis]
MTDADGRTHTIERLQSLLNRLSASDLTLVEANDLRAQVLDMLSESSAPAPVDPGSSPFRLRGRPTMACEALCC